jgi:hypothetical protein
MYKTRSYIFRTNKYLLVACRAASASSSKYGLTLSIFNFITFPGSLLGIVSMSSFSILVSLPTNKQTNYELKNIYTHSRDEYFFIDNTL